MSLAGELVVRLSGTDDDPCPSARIERPRVAERLFAGRTAAEAETLAGTIFAICGRSQAVAAACAREAAEGRVPDDATQRSRALRVAAETAQEHLWRLAADWPRLAGGEPDTQRLAAGRAVLSPLLDAAGTGGSDASARAARDWAQAALFGISPSDFLSMETMAALAGWLRGAGTPATGLALAILEHHGRDGAADTAFLPPATQLLAGRDFARALDADPAFEEAPVWRGEPRETGCLARTAGHPLVQDAIETFGRGVGARVVARLADAAMAFEALGGSGEARHGSASVSGDGFGWVETARGLLVHRARLEDGRIASWRIVAPTEWNFHPAGAFAKAAATLEPGPGLEAKVRWIVGTLDPCVAVRYEAGHA